MKTTKIKHTMCLFEKEMNEEQVNYEWILTPNNAPDDKKTGISIKGSDTKYINANRKIADIFKKKGEQFSLNGIELTVSDTQKNKPVSIQIKPKGGLSGRVNLKMYGINNRGGATIIITKVSGGDFIHVKTLAFKVIKYLLDRIIAGNITEEEIVSFKKKSGNKAEEAEEAKENICDSCENVFPTEHGLKVHRTRIHPIDMKLNCERCEKRFTTRNDLDKHQTVHENISSPESKKIRVDETVKESNIEKKYREIEVQVNEKDFDLDADKDNVEEMDIDLKEEKENDLEKRMDEKVLLKQKEIEETEEKQKEIRRKEQKLKEEEEKKRKRQMSVEKKKKKKKAKKEKSKEGNIDFRNDKLRVLDIKYTQLFKEVGLDIRNYFLYKVKADGACGSNCTALHCHHDEKLGPYVRRNINNYIVDLWPYFQTSILFPHKQYAGSEEIPFQTESEYLKFLKDDKRSGWLWMDHGDLQAVSNSYQINIHILTSNVAGMEEPKARWTHLTPDARLKSFCKIPAGLPDMWLFHVDDHHFDLIVEKDSMLATNGSIGDMVEDEEVDSIKETDLGPGYMGWQIDEKEEELGTTHNYDDLQSAYNVLKKDYEQLKKEVDELKNNSELGKNLSREIKSLKDEYKECVDALRKETHNRTKAETMTKVLKDVIQSKEEIEDNKTKESKNVEDMEIDEGWLKQQKRKNISISNIKRKSLKCEKCDMSFKDKKELQNHLLVHSSKDGNHVCGKCSKSFEDRVQLNIHSKTHNVTDIHSCEKCGKSFLDQDNLLNHLETHGQDTPYKCEQCEKSFGTIDEKNKHEKIHSRQTAFSEVKCNKCDKVYSNMSKLRRHDWRSHRQIECNICGVTLESRQEISSHRELVHQMFRKIKCRFYPDCFDEEECFFVHEEVSNFQSEYQNTKQSRYCLKGENCDNQSCEYDETKHKKIKDVLCRFQSKCNRSECMFKHVMEKASFLENCDQSSKRK